MKAGDLVKPRGWKAPLGIVLRKVLDISDCGHVEIQWLGTTFGPTRTVERASDLEAIIESG